MMFGQVQPLRLALVGAFSVGKMSYSIVLLNEQWLHTTEEEATAFANFNSICKPHYNWLIR